MGEQYRIHVWELWRLGTASFERIRAWSSETGVLGSQDMIFTATWLTTRLENTNLKPQNLVLQHNHLCCVAFQMQTLQVIKCWILVLKALSLHSLLVTSHCNLSLFESCSECRCRWIKNLKPISRRPLEGQELTANEQNKLRKYLCRVSCRILNNKQTTMRTWIKLLRILKLSFYLRVLQKV